MGITSQPTFQKDTIIVKKEKKEKQKDQDNQDKQDIEKQESCCCKCLKCNCEGNQSEKRLCMKNLSEYSTSPYCITEYCAKPLDDNDPCCDVFMTLIFCAPKQAMFFSCLIGSCINGIINDYKKTDKNYLC